MESVTRYVITYLDECGDRRLFGSQQGRNTYHSAREARLGIIDILGNNSAETLKEFCCERLEVRPCPCDPVHFDPQQSCFD